MEPNKLVENTPQRYFATTRWSMIIASRDSRSEATRAREALSQLCQIYWRPVQAFILRKGYSKEDAMDLAQDFFLKILEPGFIERADRERGKFRALLLTSLEHFLADFQTRQRAEKRGGGMIPLTIDEWAEEEDVAQILPSSIKPEGSPEHIFDLRWAFTISENSLNKLREECLRKGRERVFTELRPFLSAPASSGDYEMVQETLGLRGEAVRVLVSRLRERYRTLLREEVAETVTDERMIGEELSYLYSLLIAGREGAM